MILNFNSLRWRLPLTYAMIALLTAALLSGLLLTTLRGYYAEMEALYLRQNADTISRATSELLTAGVPMRDLRNQINSFGFLSQVRVRFLNIRREVLVDSIEGRGTAPIFMQWNREVEEGTVDILGEVSETPITIALAQPAERFNPCPPNASRCHAEAVETAPGRMQIAVAPSLYGFEFSYNQAEPIHVYSDQVIERPVFVASDQLIGYVVLSESPAYGSAIVADVARGAVLASTIAVSLAAGLGWWFSRSMSQPLTSLAGATAKMAGGDLSARTAIIRTDEIGMLADSFNHMAEQIENTVTTLRRFLADAAHELNTPLTALRTNLELAANGSPQAIQRAQAQVGRLQALTQGLLQLSRIESGSVTVQRSKIGVAAFLRETADLYASQAEQAGVTLDVRAPAESLTIEADEHQLRTALGNLIDNAIKFTPEGGSVTFGARAVYEAGQQGDARIELWVEDTGIGIAPEDAPYLFNRFYRGRNVSAYPGSGLGLAIVRAIVEHYDGHVTAQPLPTGTRFSLQLAAV